MTAPETNLETRERNMFNGERDSSDIRAMVHVFLTEIMDQVATRMVDNLQEERNNLRQRIMDHWIHEINNLKEPEEITVDRITSDTVTCVPTREENDKVTQDIVFQKAFTCGSHSFEINQMGNRLEHHTVMCKQLQAESINSTGPLHITPQLDSIPTEKSNENVRNLPSEQQKTKSRYSKVKFYCKEQGDEAENKRIVQEAEDTLKEEAIQEERRSVGNGITKRKSIGARIGGMLRYLCCCQSRRAEVDD